MEDTASCAVLGQAWSRGMLAGSWPVSGSLSDCHRPKSCVALDCAGGYSRPCRSQCGSSTSSVVEQLQGRNTPRVTAKPLHRWALDGRPLPIVSILPALYAFLERCTFLANLRWHQGTPLCPVPCGTRSHTHVSNTWMTDNQ